MSIRQKFIINGKPEIIISGAIHYFRVPHQLWEDRIIKAKQCGLNTIETYIAWNFHEYEEGKYDFSKNKDIDLFFDLCEKHNMYIFVRPGPYICAEWDNGGFPAWLNIKKGIELRTYNKVYLRYVDRWFDKLIPIIARHQINKNGKVILVQIENEYLFPYRENGKKYLEYLRDGLRKRGITVPLVACNHLAQPIRGVIETHNIGVNGLYRKIAAVYKKKYPENPLFITEFWDGWFDVWGKKHQIRMTESVRKSLKKIISSGWNYNYYMFHGGTNFGFWAGRTIGDNQMFITTSYDYDAPLSETGKITKKYLEIRELNYRARELECPKLYISKKKRQVLVLKNWKRYRVKFDKWHQISGPKSLEELRCYLGYGWYKLEVESKYDEIKTMWFSDASDRVKIYLNSKYIGTYGVGNGATQLPIKIELNKGKNTFMFLTDNLGRFCVGSKLGETKGIKGPVYFNSSKIDIKWELNKVKKIKINLDKLMNKKYSMGAGKELEKNKNVKNWLNPELNAYCIKGEFEIEKGQGCYINYIGFENDISVWINNKQIHYSLKEFMSSGFDRIKLDKYIKPGKNAIEIYFNDKNAKEKSKNIFLIKYKISNELQGKWYFQPFKVKYNNKNFLDELAFWITEFQLKGIKQPIKLKIDGLGKGQIYLNGYNVGRYWNVGPQKEYYLPEPWINLNEKNKLIVFEEENKIPKKVKLVC